LFSRYPHRASYYDDWAMVSDREVTEEELETLAAIAAALHLSEDQFVEIVREVSPGRSHR
jgi:hypothetical protein